MGGNCISLCKIRNCNTCSKKIDGSCKGCSLCDVSLCKCSKEKLKRCLVRCPRKLGTFNIIKEIKDDRVLLPNSFYDYLDIFQLCQTSLKVILTFQK